jgi:hypothetical protein
MLSHETVLDGTSKETSDTLAEIDFHIHNIICINNDDAADDDDDDDDVVKNSEGSNSNNNNNKHKLTIQHMTIDRTIASALIRLIRIIDHSDGDGRAASSTTTSTTDDEDGEISTRRCCWLWHSIRFYSCGGRHADVVVLSALYLTQSSLEIGRCNFLDDTFRTMGMELRFANNNIRRLAIVEQVIDETAAIALGRGLAENRSLQTLTMRNTHIMDHHGCVLPIANGLRENTASCLVSVNLRFCKLRDDPLAMLIRALRPDTLQELLLRGNFCREKGMKEVSKLLSHPQCQLVTLDVSRQYFMGQKRFPMDTLASGISQNRSLHYLDLMSNGLSDQDVAILAGGISDPNNATTLEHLILTGSNAFRMRGADKLLQLVKHNTTLQEIIIPVRYPRDIVMQEQICFFTNWNKCGRWIVFSSQTWNNTTRSAVTIGLWPRILERINKLDWNKNKNNKNHGTRRCPRHKNAMNPALIYAMLRNSPVLLEH